MRDVEGEGEEQKVNLRLSLPQKEQLEFGPVCGRIYIIFHSSLEINHRQKPLGPWGLRLGNGRRGIHDLNREYETWGDSKVNMNFYQRH